MAERRSLIDRVPASQAVVEADGTGRRDRGRRGAPGSLLENDWIEGHVLVQSFLMDSAPAVAKILMVALPFYGSGEARQVLLESILFLSGGDSDELLAQCQEVIVRGVWMFLEEISSGRSNACAWYAFEILEALDEDEWLTLSRAHFADLLPTELLDPDHL